MVTHVEASQSGSTVTLTATVDRQSTGNSLYIYFRGIPQDGGAHKIFHEPTTTTTVTTEDLAITGDWLFDVSTNRQFPEAITRTIIVEIGADSLSVSADDR